MSSARQNHSIAKLIVGAMTIDGSLDKREREKVAHTLETIGMGELVADVGAAIEEDDGNFNMFQECTKLLESLGSDAPSVAPLIFRVVADVVANDRYVSMREAGYLSGLAKRLGLPIEQAQTTFRQVLADRNSRLELSGQQIDETIHPHLKELLSFQGADKLVGELQHNSLEALMNQSESAGAEKPPISREELTRALTVLGLGGNATLDDAENVWRETIDNLNLPKMAGLGETFVSAAISRITRINEAYKIVLHFHDQMTSARQATRPMTAQDVE